MGVRTSEELFLLALMLRWEKAGVPDGKTGVLDGKPVFNSQKKRMAYILKMIGAGPDEGRFRTLAIHTRRQDGKGDSYISKNNPPWMEEAEDIGDGWFVEGCTNLRQKRDVLAALSKIEYSTPFIECCEEFVAGTPGNSVRRFLPTKEEAERMRAKPESPNMDRGEVPPEIQQMLAEAFGEKTSD